MKDYEVRWREANAELIREHKKKANRKYALRTKYGMTLEEFEEMMRKQKGRCAICSDVLETPHIDHDHETGRVRGLLCMNCNTGLGMFKDNPKLLAYALVYLEAHGRTF